ncbi:tyrosine-type recombinase/integrase [Macellibacteroides fermentans]|uniref:tyrosine-type recombinase/integrase n=1 Tax=Macellibacteroides fermentans TaxID=879969 RepID=UPI00406D073C
MAVLKVYQSTSYTGKDGKMPLYISFYANREKVVIPTEISIKPDCFDANKGKVTTKEKNNKDYNLIIDKLKARINNVMVRHRLRNKQLTKTNFWTEFNRPDDYDTFYVFIKDYFKTHTNEIELTTKATHEDAINKLERYAPNLHFDDIDENFLTAYKLHLRKTLKNKESTATKNMAIIKKYVRIAMKAGYIQNNPFENIKLKRNIKGKFAYLNSDELQKMMTLYKEEILTENEQNSLGLFLFMCLTGLAVTDSKKLLIEQIGAKTFTYFRVKNRNSKPDPIVVPLSIPAKKLIRKLSNKRIKGHLFTNLVADQKINVHIKKIAAQLEIEKDLSTKAGRHTFATIFLRETKDLATLKEILGHSDYRETLVYAHVMEESKLDDIRVFNKFTF